MSGRTYQASNKGLEAAVKMGPSRKSHARRSVLCQFGLKLGTFYALVPARMISVLITPKIKKIKNESDY